MKSILLIPTVLTLSGCCLFETKTQPQIPVWQPPKIEMPERPILVSDGTGTDGEVARKLSLDLISIEEYAFKLENILDVIKSDTPQTPNNNK